MSRMLLQLHTFAECFEQVYRTYNDSDMYLEPESNKALSVFIQTIMPTEFKKIKLDEDNVQPFEPSDSFFITVEVVKDDGSIVEGKANRFTWTYNSNVLLGESVVGYRVIGVESLTPQAMISSVGDLYWTITSSTLDSGTHLNSVVNKGLIIDLARAHSKIAYKTRDLALLAFTYGDFSTSFSNSEELKSIKALYEFERD